MESQVVAQMLDSLMRVLVLETIRACVWGAMAAAVTTYGVVLQARLRRK